MTADVTTADVPAASAADRIVASNTTHSISHDGAPRAIDTHSSRENEQVDPTFDEISSVIAVVGSTGFVGSAVAQALSERGVTVRHVKAPRLRAAPSGKSPVIEERSITMELKDAFNGCTAVINAAGIADAGAVDSYAIWGANAVLPGIIAAAARSAGARTVHVSSAAVQGRRATLDASNEFEGFSLYARSKITGELAVGDADHTAVIYRPPGVHGKNRPVTITVSRLARSPLASVASPGTENAPHALIENVADAIAFLATVRITPPNVVTHPSENLTTADLLEKLGNRRPVTIPRTLARFAVSIAFRIGGLRPSLLGQARRLEVLWFGQNQASSWLTEVGWVPKIDATGWSRINAGSEL
ncbi:NAD(P)-dependent oxidoreductase [Dietzia sp. UCD-THP]|uniref:NAD-dependent epimerase/dehydratase family protein n=1 Tax=Dietzia sp. UCD-THP TaxID=1292020 RepID=UPI00187D0225